MTQGQLGFQLELEGVEAKGQSLPDGFQRRFLQAPQLEESSPALQAAYLFNSSCFSFRKEPTSKFYSLQIPRLIFEVDADTMCRRPRPEKTEPAGGKTEPEIR